MIRGRPFRRRPLEAGGAKPALQRARPGGDVLQLAVIEQVSEIHQRPGLEFVGGCDLEAAEKVVHPSRLRKGPPLTQWKFVDDGADDPMGPDGVALALARTRVEFVEEEVG